MGRKHAAHIRPNIKHRRCHRTYTRRAPTYATAFNGWHVTLGEQYAADISPPPGGRCLDLACGTGLVTFPLAKAVGQDGLVVGVDVTPAMLDVARKREREEGWGRVEFVEGDIADLSEVEPVQDVVRESGFDVISCCSALVLLADPAAAIKHWADMLKKGGKLITDVPTETHTLQYLFSWELRRAMGLQNEFDRSWVENIHSLEKLCADAGLIVNKSWKTASQGGEGEEYRLEDGEEVFEQNVKKYSDFMDLEKLDETRQKFLEMWRRECQRSDGVFKDGHWLYMTIAKKP
ncbi:Aklanonic acid methyltransferase DauC [Cyphellophora attinorum]|uniref:Aklanonic acid methyltransferase DauC n=1 Tax=Cyphellophora attinorum TaxID=1664694 RepID=A0A0N0NIL8_9EURO|nr:Aklanonic acid methyltransferase DauC [Phialophora attinorum]KPI35981.1 Aklanonic acid methyltransferase DauC [Phialophora attinorum]